jgi:hypothetical protein
MHQKRIIPRLGTLLMGTILFPPTSYRCRTASVLSGEQAIGALSCEFHKGLEIAPLSSTNGIVLKFDPKKMPLILYMFTTKSAQVWDLSLVFAWSWILKSVQLSRNSIELLQTLLSALTLNNLHVHEFKPWQGRFSMILSADLWPKPESHGLNHRWSLSVLTIDL